MSAPPPRGRCQRCRHDRHVFSYRSVRDGLVRALCVGCYSATSLIEKAGHTVFWPRGSEAEPGHAGGAALFEDGRR